MGHSQNQRASENQPEKGALDTNQDKSLEENKTTKEPGEAKEEEETLESKESEEEQLAAEEGAEEELIEEEASKEEEVAEAKKEEGVAAEAEEEAAEEDVTPEKEEEIEKEGKREKAPEEEEIVEERTYTIPLRRAWISPRKKRTPRAVNIVTSFIQRHMKVEAGTKVGDEEEEKGRLVISNEVNEKLWSRGIEKPPRNIRVRAVKDKEGTVTLYLAEGD